MRHRITLLLLIAALVAFTAGGAYAQCPGGGTVISAGQMEVNAAAALEGNCGLEIIMDGTTTKRFVQDNSPNEETVYRVSFLLNHNDWDVGAGLDLERQIAIIDATAHDINGFNRAGLRVQLIRKTGKIFVKAKAITDRPTPPINGQRKTANVELQLDTDAAQDHLVEVEWSAASAPGVRDGILRIRGDGGAWKSNTLDNYGFTIYTVRFGGINGLQTFHTGSFYLDDFQSFRTLAP